MRRGRAHRVLTGRLVASAAGRHGSAHRLGREAAARSTRTGLPSVEGCRRRPRGVGAKPGTQKRTAARHGRASVVNVDSMGAGGQAEGARLDRAAAADPATDRPGHPARPGGASVHEPGRRTCTARSKTAAGDRAGEDGGTSVPAAQTAVWRTRVVVDEPTWAPAYDGTTPRPSRSPRGAVEVRGASERFSVRESSSTSSSRNGKPRSVQEDGAWRGSPARRLQSSGPADGTHLEVEAVLHGTVNGEGVAARGDARTAVGRGRDAEGCTR